jgi:peptide/nickel transport system ATP-binding protein
LVLLRVEHLVKHFTTRTGRLPAVDGVSFELGYGETLGIVGESGCGKSTLTRVLMLLEKPTAGRAYLEDRSIFGRSGTDLRALRRDMQLVLQDPYTSLNPRMTVGDIVGEPFEIHRSVAPRGDRRRRVQELLEQVGLSPEHLDRYPHQFSGGQRQRIGIARALALRPKVVLLDEPVSALDVSVQAQVVSLLARLRTELGLSYVFIAHDLAVVRQIADRVAVMYLGRIVETGTAQEIYERPTHPYTQALLSAAPVPDPEARSRRTVIRLSGDAPSPTDPPSGCRFRTRCWKAQDRCATENPPLVLRAVEPHPSACHFAERLPAAHLS